MTGPNDKYSYSGSYTDSPNNSTDDSADSDSPIKVYKRRWWILMVFSLCALAQTAHWNLWSPISDALQVSYDWETSFIAMIPAASSAGFICLGFLVMYAVEVKGLRSGLVFGACLIMITMAVWNIALGAHQYWLVIFGSLFNGIAGCVTVAAPPLLSSIWFPVNERVTATALASGSASVGNALSFLAGPHIIGQRLTPSDVAHKSSLAEVFRQTVGIGVHNVVYFNSSLAVVCFICVLVYFPDRPPRAPSNTASTKRTEFKSGLVLLSRNRSFIMLCTAYVVSNGTFNSWLPLISISFRPLGISQVKSLSTMPHFVCISSVIGFVLLIRVVYSFTQHYKLKDDAGWIGFISIMTSTVASILLSLYSDRFFRKIRKILVALTAISIAGLVILVCVQNQYIHTSQQSSRVLVYVICITVGTCINGAIPLFFELGCELTHPVHEGLTCVFITIANNIVEMLYFTMLLIPRLESNTTWMSWVVLGAMVLSLPLLIFLTERYRRLESDVVTHYGSLD